MSRQKFAAIAVGSILFAAAPIAAIAQSSGVSFEAERTCIDNGLHPGAAAYDLCVSRASAAYLRGQPAMAEELAARIARVRNLCLSYGMDPQSLGYRQCIRTEIDRALPRNFRDVET